MDSRILKELLIESCEGAFGENQKEALQRWKSTKSELMEIFAMLTSINGSSALPSRSRTSVLEEMRQKRPEYVTRLDIPQDFSVAEFFRLNPWFKLVENESSGGRSWSVQHISGQSKPLPRELEHMAQSGALELKHTHSFAKAALGAGVGPGGTFRERFGDKKRTERQEQSLVCASCCSQVAVASLS